MAAEKIQPPFRSWQVNRESAPGARTLEMIVPDTPCIVPCWIKKA